MGHERTAVVAKGQIWLLVWGGEVVRMRVGGISPDGQVTLVEVTPGETMTRVLVTSASGLLMSGALDDRKRVDSEPVEPAASDDEPTDPELRRPVKEDDDASS